MGGSALNIETVRLEKYDYDRFCKEISEKLSECNVKHHITTAYKNKQDFGDMDVLIYSHSLKKGLYVFIMENFKPNEIFSNSPVYSFDYKGFQIDFISVEPEYWEASKNYFSYNDLGNFVGRIAYNLGFRFGHYGLKLVYRHEDGGRKFNKVISSNPKEIYEFLGFDYNRYLEGFDELEDVFKYVVYSKYFNRTIFNYENLDHQNRTRNRKRKSYQAFLEFLATSQDVLPFDYEYESADYYIDKAEKFFGIELISEINRWKEIVETQKRASAKFNGNLIMENFDIKGKELGNAIANFKNMFTQYLSFKNQDTVDQLYHEYILSKSQEELLNEFARINNLNFKTK